MWWVLGLVLCTIMGFLAQKWASSAIKDMRQMERVPNVSANHLIPGEVSIHGKARQGKKLLKSRYTKTPCLYHRFLKQREERDSEGDTRWVTVESGSEATDFFLSDKTGKALVKLSRKNVKPDLSIDFRKETTVCFEGGEDILAVLGSKIPCENAWTLESGALFLRASNC